MNISKKTLLKVFLGVAFCIFFYWLLHETERVKGIYSYVAGVISPFVVGACLAFIINVPMRSIEKYLGDIKNEDLRRVVALVFTIFFVCLVVALVFWLLIPQVTQTAESVASKLPAFYDRIEADVLAFLNDNPELLEWVGQNVDLEKLDLGSWAQKILNMVSNSVSTIISGAFVAIGGMVSIVFNAVISIVFAIYCLFRKEILARQGRRLIYAFFSEKVSDKLIDILRLTNSTFSNFISGQCVEVLILGCMFAVAMAIFKMPYIPLVSVLVAVTAFIPLVGAFVGCALGALFILVDNPMQAVWFVIMFLVLQQIEGNLIYPKVVGNSIGLPGMWVLVAITVGGELMGVSGMFLMIPVASVLYALLREYTNYRLKEKNIPPEKLRDQPLELKSGFKETRERNKKARLLKKMKRNAEAQAEKPDVNKPVEVPIQEAQPQDAADNAE